jgi:hypothetical protein
MNLRGGQFLPEDLERGCECRSGNCKLKIAN